MCIVHTARKRSRSADARMVTLILGPKWSDRLYFKKSNLETCCSMDGQKTVQLCWSSTITQFLKKKENSSNISIALIICNNSQTIVLCPKSTLSHQQRSLFAKVIFANKEIAARFGQLFSWKLLLSVHQLCLFHCLRSFFWRVSKYLETPPLPISLSIFLQSF